MSLGFEKSTPAVTAQQSFDRAKQEFFSQLGVNLRKGLTIHKLIGLWAKDASGQTWENVSEHCLVEAARCEALSDALGFSPGLREDLKFAATLHDYFKKSETEIVRNNDLSWDSFAEADRQSQNILRDLQINDEIIRLATSVGHGSLTEILTILEQDTLDDFDLARLALHYIDDYTIGSDWVVAAEEHEGQKINDMDRRISKNITNERYKRLDFEGRAQFQGESTFAVQHRIGQAVEIVLAEQLSKRSGDIIEPKDLPEIIDGLVRERITSRIRQGEED